MSPLPESNLIPTAVRGDNDRYCFLILLLISQWMAIYVKKPNAKGKLVPAMFAAGYIISQTPINGAAGTKTIWVLNG